MTLLIYYQYGLSGFIAFVGSTEFRFFFFRIYLITTELGYGNNGSHSNDKPRTKKSNNLFLLHCIQESIHKDYKKDT